MAMGDFEGLDISELGGVGRFFGAMVSSLLLHLFSNHKKLNYFQFTKLGIPIPTQIGPKVLAQARDLSQGKQLTDAKFVIKKISKIMEIFRYRVVKLEPGIAISDSVNNQEAHFYTIDMSKKFDQGGLWEYSP